MRFWVVATLGMILALGCVEPKDRRPGLWLSGDVASDAIDDWSFTQDHSEISVETRTWYLIPHSVTIVCASSEGRLYVSAYRPAESRWAANVARDPNVRLKIGNAIYERRLKKVEDPEEQADIYRAYVAKYGWELLPPGERPEFRYFQVLSRR